MSRMASIVLAAVAAWNLGSPATGQAVECKTLVASMNSGGQLQGPSGTQFNAGYGARLSANGRYLAFQSGATNLVAGDTNGVDDVFVRDLLLGTTERVSVTSGGLQATGGHSGAPYISADGRLVSFSSSATNLGPGFGFVHDRLAHTTTLVSVTSSGQLLGSAGLISADGRFVVCYGSSGSSGGSWVFYLRELATGHIGPIFSYPSYFVRPRSISGDGRFIAFDGLDELNFFPGDTNGTWDVFVHDRMTGVTELVSRSAAGVQGDGESRGCSLSLDGQYISFWSRATNLVPGDGSSGGDIFVKHLPSGQVTRLTDNKALGTETYISGDGRFVLYSRNGVMRYDRSTGTVERMDLNWLGNPPGTAGNPAATAGTPIGISSDGAQVAFWTTAGNMVPGGDSNFSADLFVRDCGRLQVGNAFCFGDGNGNVPACACGNVSPEREAGCLHSGPFGMRISGEGSTSLSADDLVLHVTNTPFGATGFFFVGSQPGWPGTPLYDGLLCIGGSALRFAPQLSSNGVVSGTGFAAQDAFGYFVPGSPYFFQYFSVDPVGGNSPCGSGGNFSPGYSVLMTP